MENLKYVKEQNQILDVLLKNKNLPGLSKKMGYKFNKLARWQKNSKKLKWYEFVDLCYQLKIPLDSVITEVFGVSTANKNDLKTSVQKIIINLNPKKKQVADQLGKSKSALQRMHKLKTSPTFTSILALIDSREKYLKKFKDVLIHEATPRPTKISKSPFAVPWFGVVSSALAQNEFSNQPHSNTAIANKLNLTTAQVEEAIQVMVEHNLIEFDGCKYHPTLARTLSVSFKQLPQDFIGSLRFWTKKSLSLIENYIKKSPDQNMKSKSYFRTYSASTEATQKISALIAEFEEKVHQLLAQSTGEKTEIRCMLIHHMDITETHSN